MAEQATCSRTALCRTSQMLHDFKAFGNTAQPVTFVSWWHSIPSSPTKTQQDGLNGAYFTRIG
jgi:hypothetical protein